MRYEGIPRRHSGMLWLVSWLLLAAASAQDNETDSARSETKTTPAVRTQVYDRLVEAQTCLGDGDTDCALTILRQLERDRDLNSYERANLLSLYALVYFDLDDYASAAQSYEAVLALPREELPDGLIEASIKNLASTYWNLERPRDALAMLDQWFALPSTEPAASDWYLKGTMHYQIEEFAEGANAVAAAIRLAVAKGELGEESWYQLLAALYDELDETELAIATLTTLVENWTKRQNVLQLAGKLQQAGRHQETLILFEASYGAGWLRSSNELVALASMQLNAEMPFKAAQVLEQGLADGRIEATMRTWSMLAQAWQYAGHYERSIPAFEQASMLAEDGASDVRLAQSFAHLGRWEDCVTSLNRAFERGVDAPDHAYLQLGQCHYRLRQWDQADSAFAQAEKTERSRDTARQFRALVLSDRNTEAYYAEQLREALEDLNSVSGTDP